MKLVAPKYYEHFRCKGCECKSNCCIGWEIDIDEKTLAKYSRLRGEMGEKIQRSIVKSGEVSHFCLSPGERCPHLNEDNLCDIIIELGDEYLSDICREHPRYYLTLGDTVYGGVGLSCEAAAELILGEKSQHGYAEYPAYDFAEEDCDEELCALVLSYRNKFVECVMRAERPRELLLSSANLALELQEKIDGEKITLDPLTCHENAKITSELSKIFESLEYMKDGLLPRLKIAVSEALSAEAPTELWRPLGNIFLYFIDRYLTGAVCDGDALGAVFLGAVSFAALYLVSAREGLDLEGLLRLAVEYSSEVEYCEENIESIKAYVIPELLFSLADLF